MKKIFFLVLSSLIFYSCVDDVEIQILTLNDFHGNLSTLKNIGDRQAGGAVALASYLRRETAHFDGCTFIVHSGDMVGASPPASGMLQDEPVIHFLNFLSRPPNKQELNFLNDYLENEFKPDKTFYPCGVIGAPGNHSFDEGTDEFLRLIKGGNHLNGPFLQDPYRGADYDMTVANVVYGSSGDDLLSPYIIKKVGGVKIAFIGCILRETKEIVIPSGVNRIDFLYEVDAVNRVVRKLKKKGIEAFIVLLHEGASQKSYPGETRRGASSLSGPAVQIVRGLDGSVDIVVAGHHHKFSNKYITNAGGKETLIVQAYSSGTAYGKIECILNLKTKDIVQKSAQIKTAYTGGGDVSNVQDIKALTAAAEDYVKPVIERKICVLNKKLVKTDNPLTGLGALIADSARLTMDADIAFMNIGGIRSELNRGTVTYGDLFEVLPFGNHLVKMKLTGSQIQKIIEKGVPDHLSYPLLYISVNFPLSSKSVSEIKTALKTFFKPDDYYEVAVNNFLADSGDGFKIFQSGIDVKTGIMDIDAFEFFLKNHNF